MKLSVFLMPPAMPNMPEMNVVTSTVARMIRVVAVNVMPGGLAQFAAPGQMRPAPT